MASRVTIARIGTFRGLTVIASSFSVMWWTSTGYGPRKRPGTGTGATTTLEHVDNGVNGYAGRGDSIVRGLSGGELGGGEPMQQKLRGDVRMRSINVSPHMTGVGWFVRLTGS